MSQRRAIFQVLVVLTAINSTRSKKPTLLRNQNRLTVYVRATRPSQSPILS